MKYKMQMILFGSVLLSLVSSASSQTMNLASGDAACCIGIRGDVNGDGSDNTILDLNYMVNDIFRGGAASACPLEADLNSDGTPSTILDLNFIVNDIFRGGPAPGPCETGITPAARIAVADGATHLLDSLYDDPEVYEKIAAYLNAQPEIDTAAVVYAPITVWAIFTDSVLYFISNNRLPESPSKTEPKPAIQIEPVRTVPAVTLDLTGNGRLQVPDYARIPNSGLPLSTDAVFLNTLGSTFNPITQTLASWLGARGYGAYTGGETVEDLKTLSDLGVLFFSTHGAAGYFDPNMTDSAYSLWSSTEVTVGNLPTYLGELRTKRLTLHTEAINIAPNGAPILQLHYGITSKFITYYWPDFPDNAMVYIDCCGSDGPYAQPLKQAILAKNAGVYFGWTYSVNFDASNLVAQFMIDRLLGANVYQSYKEIPPQRPFDYVSIYQDLQSRNLHAHPTIDSLAAPGGVTVFKYTAGAGDFGLLVPSIRYMAVIEHFDTLYVTGLFGEDPRPKGCDVRVLVGGTELIIYSWQPWLIMTFIPNTGVGSVGPVTVEIDGVSQTTPLLKRTSNVVNLTQWDGVFTYTEDESGSLLGTIEINAKLRADIHNFREYPHAPLSFYSIIFLGMESSYGTASASGTYSYTYPDSDPVSTDTWTWDGSHPLVGLSEQDPSGFLLTGQINGATKILQLRLVAVEFDGMTETLVNSESGFQYTNPIGFGIPFEMYDTPPNLFNINMSNVWDILGSQRIIHECCLNYPPYPAEDIEHKLIWPTIPASWAPDTTAAQ